MDVLEKRENIPELADNGVEIKKYPRKINVRGQTDKKLPPARRRGVAGGIWRSGTYLNRKIDR